MLKKLFLALILGVGISLSGSAQTVWYKAFSYAYHQKTSYGTWENWTPWYSCDIDMKIDWDNDYIVIYSQTTQRYMVVSYDGQYQEPDGGTQAQFKVIDQDSDRGYIRLRIEASGNSQLYVDFNNISWVYNIRKR
jgi:hypothetical protein